MHAHVGRSRGSSVALSVIEHQSFELLCFLLSKTHPGELGQDFTENIGMFENNLEGVSGSIQGGVERRKARGKKLKRQLQHNKTDGNLYLNCSPCSQDNLVLKKKLSDDYNYNSHSFTSLSISVESKVVQRRPHLT